mgnify:CR=1 FL=1|tara:strand:- start:348 stop:1490 length:1143 start_codon:yes stop_codon:yes gene_type:complete
MLGDKKVLIVGPPLDGPGGVSGYYRSILPFLTEKSASNYSFEYLRVGERSGLVGRIKPVSLFVDICNFFLACLKFRPSLVHVNPSLSNKSLIRDAILTLIAKSIFNAKILVYFRGWDKHNENYVHSRLWFFKMTLLQADQYLTLSEHSKAKLIDWGVNKDQITISFTVINPSLEKFLRDESNSTIFGSRTINQKIRVLFLGRLIKAKGLYELLDGFEQAHKINDKLELIIAGDGPELDSLISLVNEKRIRGSVKFLGYVKDKEKFEILASSHVFMLPSYTEGMPNSVLEAMAAGCLVYTTSVGSLTEFIRKGWVRPIEVADSGSIFAALTDSQLARDYLAMRINTSEIALANFNHRAVCGGLLASYDNVFNRAHTTGKTS